MPECVGSSDSIDEINRLTDIRGFYRTEYRFICKRKALVIIVLLNIFQLIFFIVFRASIIIKIANMRASKYRKNTFIVISEIQPILRDFVPSRTLRSLLNV